MNILFLTPHPKEGASTRFRVQQFFPYFTSQGINCIFRPFLSSNDYKILYKDGQILKKGFILLRGICKRVQDFISSNNIDIVFVHLEASPLGLPIFENLFSFCGKPIIYDLDDAIYLKGTSPVNKLAYFLKSSSKIPKIISKSSYVIVCNEYLEDYAKKFNQNVKMIPTVVNTDKFTVKDHSIQNEKLVIGWIGSHSTACYLAQLTEVFKKIAEKYKFTLKIIGSDKRDYFPGIDVIYDDWSLEKDVLDFHGLDIGIYPLPDNEWVKGKTGFKTVQYMSVGVPCVASRIGKNINIITDGVDGYLASSQDEWIKKLSLLIENSEFRKTMGLAGRKTVEDRYSLSINAPKYLEVFDRVCKRKRIFIDCAN